MNRQLAERLLNLHNDGYSISVDTDIAEGLVKDVYERDDEIVYDTERLHARSFHYIDVDLVTVLKPVEKWWS